MIKEFIDAKILNVLSQDEYLRCISETLHNSYLKTFTYLNSYSYYLFHNNPVFKKAFLEFDYIIPDGYSIVWAARKIDKMEIKKVVFTYSFFEILANFFSNEKIKIFFLGGKNSTIKKAIDEIELKFPDLLIAGFTDGYFNSDYEEEIVRNINSSNAEVLIVGIGMPKSEVWIQKIKTRLNVKCIFSVGGFFDFASMEKDMAPGIFFNSGFEWLYRFLQEPARLWKRYLKCNLYFLYKVLTNSTKI